MLSAALKQTRGHALNLSLAEVAGDPRRGLSSILDVVLHDLQRGARSVLVLADFGTLVPQRGVAEIETMLSSLLRGERVSCITQYDAGGFRDPIDVSGLRAFGTVVVGDYFHHQFGWQSPRPRSEVDETAKLELQEQGA